MEYFPFGTIESHRKDFHGKPLGTLRAIRGAVEAVSELNKKNYFHRDIKPNNIFVAGDGRWVLGDLGIALHPENTAHTAPGHQLFSRDWIPDWCVDFPDRYDAVAEVHTLAKTILYMVSGKKPRASSMPDIDLVAEFPNTPGMRDLQELLRAEIKSRKDETASKTATDFLAHVDRVIDRLTRPALPTLLFSYLNAAGQPFANVDNTRIYSVTRTRQLIAAFKFRADSGQGSGRFKYGLKDIGISNPIEVENPPPQGDWVVHHMIHLQSDLEPGWYTLVLDTSMLGRVQLIGAMIYG